MENEKPILTRNEAAELLGVNFETLNRWAMKKYGPPFSKMGTSRNAAVRYLRKDVLEYLEKTKVSLD